MYDYGLSVTEKQYNILQEKKIKHILYDHWTLDRQISKNKIEVLFETEKDRGDARKLLEA